MRSNGEAMRNMARSAGRPSEHSERLEHIVRQVSQTDAPNAIRSLFAPLTLQTDANAAPHLPKPTVTRNRFSNVVR